MSTALASTRSDEELMRLVQRADDREAFACLYDRYESKAIRVARSVCATPARAEEAVQDGFLSIWRSRAGFDSAARGTFGAWSMTVVRYAAINAVRHDTAKRRPVISGEPLLEMVDSNAPSPEDQVIARDGAGALRATLTTLPEAQAEVIQLAFFGELSHSEIAHLLDVPPGTVKGRMRLGLEKLRTRIDRDL